MANTAEAAKLLESVATQTKLHRAQPQLACAVQLLYNNSDVFVQRFSCRGFTPIQCIKKHLFERGLMTIVQAVVQLRELHRLGYFQGGMCNEQILLFVQHDFDACIRRGQESTQQMAVFLDWSSTCKLACKPSIHPKRYYGGLKDSSPTAAQLVTMDLDAAMFAFNDYVRQAFEMVEMYLLRYEHATGDFTDGNVAIDFLGNLICPTKQELELFQYLIGSVYKHRFLKVSETSKANDIAAARAPFMREIDSLWKMKQENPKHGLYEDDFFLR